MKGLNTFLGYYLQVQGVAMGAYTVYFMHRGPRPHETQRQTLYRLSGDLTNIILWPAYLYSKIKDKD